MFVYIYICSCIYIMGIGKGPPTNVGPGPPTSLIRPWNYRKVLQSMAGPAVRVSE